MRTPFESVLYIRFELLLVLLVVFNRMRSGTNYRRLSVQDIQELQQLIETVFPQERTTLVTLGSSLVSWVTVPGCSSCPFIVRNFKTENGFSSHP